MDSTMISTLAVIGMAFFGAWIQLNKRIAILENQQKNDHDILLGRTDDIKDVKKDIEEIKESTIELRGDLKLKQNRKFKEE